MGSQGANPLSERERALENAFFRKVDDQLLQDLKTRMAQDRELEQLATDTGIHDRQVLQELMELGFTPHNLLALWLVPLAQVAWADGHVDPSERQAVRDALQTQGYTQDTPVARMLEAWLEHQPSEDVLNAWKDYAAALARSAGEKQLTALRNQLRSRAREVAESAGGVFGFGRVSKDEQSVLARLDEALATD